LTGARQERDAVRVAGRDLERNERRPSLDAAEEAVSTTPDPTWAVVRDDALRGFGAAALVSTTRT
jgi:hypothetical protein